MNARERLKSSGLRATPGRIAILNVLQSGGPRTAENVHTSVKTLDLVTVYRNLQSLAAAGIVHEVRFKDTAVRYEISEEHHHHVVCTSCGTIDELQGCDTGLDARALHASKHFASVTEHSLEFFGICKSCAQ